MIERQHAIAVKWSPFDMNEFVIAGKDLRLFRATFSRGHIYSDDARFVASPPSNPTGSSLRSATLKSAAEGLQPRCLAWSPSPLQPLLAVGDSVGRVTLLETPFHFPPARVFCVPNAKRPCVSIAWNPVDHAQIAVGFDRLK